MAREANSQYSVASGLGRTGVAQLKICFPFMINLFSSFFRYLAASSSFARVTFKTKRISIPNLKLELKLELKTTNATKRTLSFGIILLYYLSSILFRFSVPKQVEGGKESEVPYEENSQEN